MSDKKTMAVLAATAAIAAVANDAADPHAGMGGAYEMVDGKRVLMHRTEDQHVQLAESEGGAEPVAELNAASVGVAPPPLEVGRVPREKQAATAASVVDGAKADAAKG